MPEEYKSAKTRQVMRLVNGSSVNSYLPGNPQSVSKRNATDTVVTIEDRIRSYTASKRGTGTRKVFKRSKASEEIRNPILHIPEQETQPAAKQAQRPLKKQRSHEKITIDINRVILDEMLEDSLVRFNTCHCKKCRDKITELVLDEVPVKIVTVSEGDEQSVIESYCKYTKHDISSAIVRVIVANKRKPFHDM